MNVPKLRFKEFNDKYNITKVSEIIDVIDGDRGNNYPKANDFYDSEFCLFLNAGNVTKNGFNFKNNQFITKEKDKKLRKGKLLINDVVLTTRGTVGNVAWFNEKTPYKNIRINSGMVINRIKENGHLLPEYLYSYMKSPVFENQVNKMNYGSAQPQLTVSGINKFNIQYPTINEQKKVSTIMLLLDKKIELQSKKIEDLKLFKKGLLIKEFNNKKSSNKLKECFDFGKAGGTPKSTNKDYYNGYIPFLSISDMTTQGKYIYYTDKSITEAGLNNSTAWLVPKNSIIISMYASYGLVSINKIDLTTSQAMFNMVINKNYVVEYIYYYLYYLYISNFYNSIVSTGTQSNLNAEQIKLLDIYIPCYNEQKRIYEQFSKIDFKINLEQKKINELLYLKKGLMQNMFV